MTVTTPRISLRKSATFCEDRSDEEEEEVCSIKVVLRGQELGKDWQLEFWNSKMADDAKTDGVIVIARALQNRARNRKLCGLTAGVLMHLKTGHGTGNCVA